MGGASIGCCGRMTRGTFSLGISFSAGTGQGIGGKPVVGSARRAAAADTQSIKANHVRDMPELNLVEMIGRRNAGFAERDARLSVAAERLVRGGHACPLAAIPLEA
jgi:hypothetical protein